MKFAVLFLSLCCLSGIAFAGDLSERVLVEINRARTNPQEYAQVVQSHTAGSPARDVAEAVRFLQKARAMTPLAFSPGLSQGANLHVVDQGARGSYGHNGSGWGNTPWSRMARFGQWVGCAGENIYYGSRDAQGIVCAWIIDAGVSGRAHRKNLFSTSFGVAGVACGPHAAYGGMCVMDFAGSYVEKGSALAGL